MDWKTIETAKEEYLPFLGAHVNKATRETCGYYLIIGRNVRKTTYSYKKWWVDDRGNEHPFIETSEKPLAKAMGFHGARSMNGDNLSPVRISATSSKFQS
jgi:hypothetical protein